MPFLTKPSLIVKKTPLIGEKCDEDVVEMQTDISWAPSRLPLGSLVCMVIGALFVTMIGIFTGFMIYRQYVRPPWPSRYQGFCTVSVNGKTTYERSYFPSIPLRWFSWPEVSVAAEDEDPLAVGEALREELDIGDNVERISVVDNGRHVSFIHDFDANFTGIVDSERCFTSELDPEVVLAPELFVVSIDSGEAFDVTRVRTPFKAMLAARAARPAPLLELCRGKPIYPLVKDDTAIIRKRSADAPPHDYIQFAGRHLQEIEIVNLADLLQAEQAGDDQ